MACSKVHSRLAESCNFARYKSTGTLPLSCRIAVLLAPSNTAPRDNFASRVSYRVTGNYSTRKLAIFDGISVSEVRSYSRDVFAANLHVKLGMMLEMLLKRLKRGRSKLHPRDRNAEASRRECNSAMRATHKTHPELERNSSSAAEQGEFSSTRCNPSSRSRT